MLFSGGEGERSCRYAATHCWRYRIILRKKDFARILRRLPLARLPLSRTASGRLTPSLAGTRRSVQIFLRQKEKQPDWVAFLFGKVV